MSTVNPAGTVAYGLYTYQPSGDAGDVADECHIYTADAEGRPLTLETAQAAGTVLEAANPNLGFMVEPLEQLPSAPQHTIAH